MNKLKLLEKLKKEIENCELCKKEKKGKIVFGEGNLNSKLIFIGEAPGYNESKIGKPFIGRAGKFLNKLFQDFGIKREEVYLTSPLKFYPGRRSIKDWEIEHSKKHIKKQIEIINPKIVVLLGNIALKAILDKKNIFKMHGKVIKNERIFLPTFHPSAAMRFPKIKKLMEKDFKILKRLLKKIEKAKKD